MRVPTGLHARHAAVLDTNLLIYLFEDHPEFGAATEYVFTQIATGAFHGLITPMTIAELLVKPVRNQRMDLADRYRSAMSHMMGVELISLTPEAGILAGALRAQYDLPLPDMMQAAAMRYAEPILITQDAQLKQLDDIQVYSLDDFSNP